MPNIVVIGAGVAGLTSALLLSRDPKNKVTIVARHMPGDSDIEYTSPWAGANVLPMSDAPGSRWEQETWPEFRRLAKEVPEAGVHFQKALVLRKKKGDAPKAETKTKGPAGPKLSESLFDADPWFRNLMDDYRDLPADQVLPGFDSSSEFTSVCINPVLYLPWLVGQCRKQGVVLRRAVLTHVTEAADYAALEVGPDGATVKVDANPKDTIIVNCSGLLACRLGGVMDAAVQPARGQTVVIRDELSPMLAVEGLGASVAGDHSGSPHNEMIYNMTRAAGGGTVIGGTYQVGNWESQPDPNTALRLLTRIAATHPTLVAQKKTAADLSVIRHGVGLRPYRTGGVRLESEEFELETDSSKKVWVVHNYGHSSWGYQGSYGCSNRVVELVAEIAAKA